MKATKTQIEFHKCQGVSCHSILILYRLHITSYRFQLMVWCMNFYSSASDTKTHSSHDYQGWWIVPSFKCNGNQPHTNPIHIATGLVYTPSPLQLPHIVAITELCFLYSHGCRQQNHWLQEFYSTLSIKVVCNWY